MANDRRLVETTIAKLFEKYLAEACEAKVSVKVGRSLQLVAYNCFPDMADAWEWAEANAKKFKKSHKVVQIHLVNRTERQWRNARRKLPPRPKLIK